MKLLRFLASLALALSPALALPSATGNRILVILDQSQSTYSTFLDQLTSRGYSLTFKAPKDLKPVLVQHDVKAYDHLILLTPGAKALSPDLSPQALVNYLRDGGNVLFGLDSAVSELFRDLSREFSVEVEERGSALIDHFNFDKKVDSGNHTAVLLGPGRELSIDLPSGGILENRNVFSQKTIELAKSKPLLYRGIAHRLGSNPLSFPLVVSAATSYSSEAPEIVRDEDAPKSTTSYSQPDPITSTIIRMAQDGSIEESTTVMTPKAVPTVVKAPSGESKGSWTAKGRSTLQVKKDIPSTLSLVSAFQLKDNSARAIFLGSVDMLSNSFLSPQTLNSAVAVDLTSWLFQEKSVIKVHATHHSRVKAGPNDLREDYEETLEANKIYRIKDHVTFSMELESWDSQRGWVPAQKDLDLQVSFKMLDPFVTMALIAQDDQAVTKLSRSNSSKVATTYAASFQIPDRHGVFTFLVDWKRHGFTYILTKDTAPVRPFNHDEYPRFLSSSWPYIAGAFSTVLGFLLFTFLWFGADDVSVKKSQ